MASIWFSFAIIGDDVCYEWQPRAFYYYFFKHNYNEVTLLIKLKNREKNCRKIIEHVSCVLVYLSHYMAQVIMALRERAHF